MHVTSSRRTPQVALPKSGPIVPNQMIGSRRFFSDGTRRAPAGRSGGVGGWGGLSTWEGGHPGRLRAGSPPSLRTCAAYCVACPLRAVRSRPHPALRATLSQRAEDTTVSPRPGIRGEGISKSPPRRGGRRPGWVSPGPPAFPNPPRRYAAQRGNVSSKQPSMRDTFPLSLPRGDGTDPGPYFRKTVVP